MHIKKIFYLLILLVLTGCNATYNLEIDSDGFHEEIVLDNLIEVDDAIVPLKVYYNEEENNEDPMDKLEGTTYHDSIIKENDDGTKKIIYNYLLPTEKFNQSNIVNSFYDTLVFRRYDHDEDGENDYMLISASEAFNIFQYEESLDKITINIISNYEVISSNADEVNKNIHTWYLDRTDIKDISMVYNPDNFIDYRSFWQKVMDGDYINAFTVSIVICIVGFIIYAIFKKYSQKVDEV